MASLNFFNCDITSKAKERKEKGQNIRATDAKTQPKDGLHQNEIGYKVMEENWVKVNDDYIIGN